MLLKPATRLLLLLSLLVAGLAAAEVPNTQCIVSPDEPIEPGLTVSYEGVTYGVCCPGCRRDFNQDPAGYVAAWKARQAATTTPPPPEPAAEPSDHHEPAPATASNPDTHEGQAPTANGHDHADHGHEAAASSNGPGLIAWLGRFHVVVIHFPITLLICAALAALIDALRPSPGLQQAGRLATHVGAASAVVAALLGWATWTVARYPDATETLLLHQISGTVTAVLAVPASILAGYAASGPRHLLGWRISVIICGITVAMAGHFGGLLIYGSAYFSW